MSGTNFGVTDVAITTDAPLLATLITSLNIMYNLLVTARETGQAVLDYARHNKWLSDSFERAYGIPIKNYFDECMGRKKLEASYGPDYMEYQCWYSLLLRVFLIIHEPTAVSDVTQSAVAQASEKLKGMERRYGEVGEVGE